jgi:hypothetical protein
LDDVIQLARCNLLTGAIVQETFSGEQELESAFSFLVKEQGFTVAKRLNSKIFDNGKIEYHSANCYVTIGLDRSSVYVMVAPTEQARKVGLDLSLVVSYLTNGRIKNVHVAYDVLFQPELPYSEFISTQATKLAVALNDYLPAIRDLFSNTPAEEIVATLLAYSRAGRT